MPIRVARDRVATPKHLERREGIERGRETAHPRLVGSHDARAHTRKAAGKRVELPALALKRSGQRVEQALLDLKKARLTIGHDRHGVAQAVPARKGLDAKRLVRDSRAHGALHEQPLLADGSGMLLEDNVHGTKETLAPRVD